MDSLILESPIGRLKICAENGRITRLCLLQEATEPAPALNNMQHSALLNEACRQLDEYFRGRRRAFDLPIGGAGTAFQQRVWEQLRRIPYGETRSYADIAAAIGNPRAVRAVGQANNKNPILILTPCHRVIYKSGDLAGFGCGTEVKRYLLELEHRNICGEGRIAERI